MSRLLTSGVDGRSGTDRIGLFRELMGDRVHSISGYCRSWWAIWHRLYPDTSEIDRQSGTDCIGLHVELTGEIAQTVAGCIGSSARSRILSEILFTIWRSIDKNSVGSRQKSWIMHRAGKQHRLGQLTSPNLLKKPSGTVLWLLPDNSLTWINCTVIKLYLNCCEIAENQRIEEGIFMLQTYSHMVFWYLAQSSY